MSPGKVCLTVRRELSAVSINPRYRILLYFLIKDNVIYPVDIGKHDDVYR